MSRVGCTSKPIQVEFTKSIVVWLAALDVLKLLIFCESRMASIADEAITRDIDNVIARYRVEPPRKSRDVLETL
jgi:hypothetical protein